MSETTEATTEVDVDPLAGFQSCGNELGDAVRVDRILSSGQDPFAPAKADLELRAIVEAAGNPEALAALPESSAIGSWHQTVITTWQSSVTNLGTMAECPHPSVKKIHGEARRQRLLLESL